MLFSIYFLHLLSFKKLEFHWEKNRLEYLQAHTRKTGRKLETRFYYDTFTLYFVIIWWNRFQKSNLITNTGDTCTHASNEIQIRKVTSFSEENRTQYSSPKERELGNWRHIDDQTTAFLGTFFLFIFTRFSLAPRSSQLFLQGTICWHCWKYSACSSRTLRKI